MSALVAEFTETREEIRSLNERLAATLAAMDHPRGPRRAPSLHGPENPTHGRDYYRAPFIPPWAVGRNG